MTGWLRIRIMCLSGVIGVVQSGPRHHFIQNKLVLTMI
jgi:hypothetical protein